MTASTALITDARSENLTAEAWLVQSALMEQGLETPMVDTHLTAQQLDTRRLILSEHDLPPIISSEDLADFVVGEALDVEHGHHGPMII